MIAANALLQAIHQRLSTDPGLTALLGPDGIRDRLLPRPKLPCITFGDMDTRDFSASSEGGEEHFLTLEIWSDSEGRRNAHQIAALVATLLHDAALPLEGATLVNILHVSSRSRRQPKTTVTLTDMRFRAVTE